MRRTFFVLAAALLLAGCAEVPEGVQTESREVSEEKPTEIEYISPGEMRSDADTALARSYKQFILKDGLTVSLPEEYNEVDFVQAEGYEAKLDKYAARVFDKETLAGTTVDTGDFVENPRMDTEDSGSDLIYTSASRLIRDEEKQIHINMHSSGFFCFMRGEGFLDPEPGRTAAVFLPQQGDDLSKTFELKGESVSVADAVKYAEKWIADNYADLEPDYQFRTSCVTACQNDMGEYCYRLQFEKVYKGVELNSAVNPDYVGPEGGAEHLVNIAQTVDLQMRSRDDICFLTNGNGVLLPKGEHKLEKVASLSSVLGWCENKFSDLNTPYTVTEISLAYSLSPKYDSVNLQSPFHPGISYDSRLVWQIVMDAPDEERFGTSGYVFDKEYDPYGSAGRLARYIQIDAETGEMEFEFDLDKVM